MLLYINKTECCLIGFTFKLLIVKQWHKIKASKFKKVEIAIGSKSDALTQYVKNVSKLIYM